MCRRISLRTVSSTHLDVYTRQVLVLSDQSGSGDHSWLAVSDKTATGTTEDGYYVEYAYDKLVTAWESDDFADLKGVRAATWGLWDSASGTTLVKSTTIKSIEWIAAEEITEPDGYKINFDSSDDIPAYTDERTIPEASEIKEGGKFRVVHTNSSANVVLAMTGTEKKHSWVNVSDKTTGTTEDGYAYAEFGYDAIVTAWESEDFSDYSYVRAQTWSEETIIISIEWIPAAETEGNTAPATEITGTFEDGSQGWTVEVDASALTSGAQWVITNSDNETAEFDAVIEPSVEGNVRIGLVLTETAIGDNTITGVSLKY